jgi:hypothetical protein
VATERIAVPTSDPQRAHEQDQGRGERAPATALDRPGSHLWLQRTAGNAAVTALVQRRSAQPHQNGPTKGAEAPTDVHGEDKAKVQRQQPPTGAGGAQANAGGAGAGTLTPEQKQTFINKCTEANTAIDAADRGFSAWLSSIAISYGQAWQQHTDTLNNAKLQAQQLNDMVFGFILAFVPGGVGGVVGGSMQKLVGNTTGTGAFLVDGMKDLTKWGLRTAGAAEGPKVSLQPFPMDPLQWQNQTNMRVKNELGFATTTLKGWLHSVNTNDPNFDATFDPAAAMDASLTLSGTAVKSLTPVAMDVYRKIFQRGWLTDWVKREWPEQSKNCLNPEKMENQIKDYARTIDAPGLFDAWDSGKMFYK